MNIVPERYRVEERGVLSDRGIFVYTPSAFARENLFYVQLASIYTCSPEYSITRQGPDSYLIFYIEEGTMQFSFEGKDFQASPGDIVLIDCRKKHHYHAVTTVCFHWIHFSGASSDAYFSRFMAGEGIHFTDCSSMELYFSQIRNLMTESFPDEDLLSVYLHRILALLASSRGPSGIRSSAVSAAKEYMDRHFREKITNDDLAALSAVSASHFSRLFREEAGKSPYQYLMQVRLTEAQKMLLETSLSVEEIASECSFCSAANFIRCFKNYTGTTPHRFRTLITGMTSAI